MILTAKEINMVHLHKYQKETSQFKGSFIVELRSDLLFDFTAKVNLDYDWEGSPEMYLDAENIELEREESFYFQSLTAMKEMPTELLLTRDCEAVFYEHFRPPPLIRNAELLFLPKNTLQLHVDQGQPEVKCDFLLEIQLDCGLSGQKEEIKFSTTSLDSHFIVDPLVFKSKIKRACLASFNRQILLGSDFSTYCLFSVRRFPLEL